jgi:hypothetical protein
MEEDMIYTIYKATNLVNDKVYIGFDSKWPNRKEKHKYNSVNPKYAGYYSHFYCAIRKYGWENFQFDVLYQSKDKDHTLSEMERHFITEHKSFYGFEDCNGYNMTLGGEGFFGSEGNAKKEFQLIDPDGNIITIKNLRKFCREKGLTFTVILQVCKGGRKYANGYRNINFPDYVPRPEREYRLLTPENDVIVIKNMIVFSEESGLNLECLRKLFRGNIKSYRGYSVALV